MIISGALLPELDRIMSWRRHNVPISHGFHDVMRCDVNQEKDRLDRNIDRYLLPLSICIVRLLTRKHNLFVHQFGLTFSGVLPRMERYISPWKGLNSRTWCIHMWGLDHVWKLSLSYNRVGQIDPSYVKPIRLNSISPGRTSLNFK